MPDFYDDAVLEFDGYFAEVIGHLKRTGKLERTLIVLGSDHGIFRETDTRLPLIIRLPAAPLRGKVSANAQTIDIAPTMLDLLGVEKPSWMTGASLLSRSTDPARPIFVSHNRSDRKRVIRNNRVYKYGPEEIVPPSSI